MDPELMDGMIMHVRLDVSGGAAVASEMSKEGHAYTLYSFDEQGERHSSGEPNLQRDVAVQASRDLRVPLVIVNHDLIRRIRDVRQQLATLAGENTPSIPPTVLEA